MVVLGGWSVSYEQGTPAVGASRVGWIAMIQMLAEQKEREIFIDNLLVRAHLIIEMILVDRPCAMEVCIPFPR